MFLLFIFLTLEGILPFSFGLKDTLQTPEKNAIFSPLSIATTLGMTAIGAKDQTYLEMRQALHFTGSQEELSNNFKNLLSGLRQKETSNNHFTLNLETVLWMQKDFQFLPVYQSEVVNDFSGELRSVDFTKPETAVKEMNQWFFHHSGGLLGPLFTNKDISADARLVAISTLYLKAYFENPFESTHTRSVSFHVNSEKEIPIDMMYQKNTFPYYQGEDFQAVELQYLPVDSGLALWIILPKSIDRFQFNQATVELLLNNLKPQTLELEIPSFRMESTLNLIPALQALGIKQAFNTNANFSLITEANNLMISQFKHRVALEVAEGGTVAEAVSSATFIMKSLPLQKEAVSFIANRPFLFMIMDKKNQIPLFMGQVIEPKILRP